MFTAESSDWQNAIRALAWPIQIGSPVTYAMQPEQIRRIVPPVAQCSGPQTRIKIGRKFLSAILTIVDSGKS
jgi:hypothetical protein